MENQVMLTVNQRKVLEAVAGNPDLSWDEFLKIGIPGTGLLDALSFLSNCRLITRSRKQKADGVTVTFQITESGKLALGAGK